ncbi:MAG TPA: hypothetical protein VJ698_06255 [Noviherbaspirillum sp.]|uniref:hypothetical protein n=1 Tax=Noviherbaspirillum sp. TaxID=1926288 RepID=UPI002B487B0A|nr:hypothetical protein [Noviherbaspirillum sp.]HJV85059.1 hypothetical protein [Noviherbaspirillum sp.]
MQRVLSFEQTPPLSVPLRFFLTAPLFAIAAGLVLLWEGPDALASRWSPVTLALTHLMTLGFLAMCMIGALMQILPVVAGIDIPHSNRTAAVAHALLTAGTLALVAGFLLSSPLLFEMALPLLAIGFAWLFLAGLRGVWRAPDGKDMLTAIRLALTALAVVVVLGLVAASAFAWGLSLPLPVMTIANMHAGWGLLGWVGLLVIGVAYQVVPMFQVTPTYPQYITRWLAKTVFSLIAIWSVAQVLAAWTNAVAALLALAFALFAGTTFYLLWRRKRPKPDPTTLFWRAGLSSLLAGTVLWLAGTLFPALAAIPAYPLLLGLLFIVGFAASVINGMLYKIVPFLVWYHLQNKLAGGCAKAPNVKQILPDRVAERQFRAHLLALVLLLAAALLPAWLSQVAALSFIASSAWLWLNIWKAARIYRTMTADLSKLREPA